MELLFTAHAVLRMAERKISEAEVYEVFQRPFLTFETKSVLVIGHTALNRYLTLVLDLKKHKLLTIWPSSQQERRLYKRRMDQEE